MQRYVGKCYVGKQRGIHMFKYQLTPPELARCGMRSAKYGVGNDAAFALHLQSAKIRGVPESGGEIVHFQQVLSALSLSCRRSSRHA